jgi:hypothetical protein
LHGGQVSAWSEGSGQGSTFEVRLPKPRPLFKVVPKPSRPASREIAPAGRQSAARIAVGTHL